MAESAIAAQKCDLVGNPYEDSLSEAQRQSVDFANFTASLRKRTGGAIEVDVVDAGRRNQSSTRHKPSARPRVTGTSSRRRTTASNFT